MDETKTETSFGGTTHGSRIQPRRSSRSTLASSPTTNTKEDRHGVLPTPDGSLTPAASPSNTETPLNNSGATLTNGAPTTSTANHQSRVTRSLSADSNSNEESSTSANTTSITNGKRRRHTNNSKSSTNKKKSNNNPSTPSPTPSSSVVVATPLNTDDVERETRHTTQRLSKEAKDSRRAEREIIVKKKLGELEAFEEKVRNQSHEGYKTLLQDIQAKRNKKLVVAQDRHALMASNFKNGFLAQKKSAEDQFHLDKLALRRTMIHQVQQKINRIEQEYFSSLQQGGPRNLLDEPHLNEWIPPDRPSMINILFYFLNLWLLLLLLLLLRSLTLGLDEQQVDQDFAELQDLLPSMPPPSIEEHHPLDSSKKDNPSLIPST
ncbi:hypothetical protein BC941DRAFT_476367 [Chlamydoabsidia padenii]|nr:hypothetical protein BC941DRAFT_476367 [Chlamydoabsidia padenii]